jgi:hypothetical protein
MPTLSFNEGPSLSPTALEISTMLNNSNSALSSNPSQLIAIEGHLETLKQKSISLSLELEQNLIIVHGKDIDIGDLKRRIAKLERLVSFAEDNLAKNNDLISKLMQESKK